MKGPTASGPPRLLPRGRVRRSPAGPGAALARAHGREPTLRREIEFAAYLLFHKCNSLMVPLKFY